MDETKETQENPLSATEKASEGSEGTTPTKEAKTQYTQEEVDKLLQADRIKRGRDDKTLATRKAELDAQQAEIVATRAEISRLQEQIDQAELEAAQGDPAKLKELQAKKSYKNLLADLETQKKELTKQRQEFERDKAEHSEKVKAAEQVTLDMKLYEVAARHELNPEDLKAGIKKLNLTTVEQAEALAETLKATGERPPESQRKTTTPVSVPTTGGARAPTLEELEKKPMDDYAAYVKNRDAKK